MTTQEKPDGPPEKSSYALWVASGESKPLTLESIQACMEKLRDAPPSPYLKRIVSHEVYKRAEEAIADGASYFEVEYILAGASRELAKEMAGNF